VSLLRRLDKLESTTDGYLALEDAQRAVGHELTELIAEQVLLVDFRQRLDASGSLQPLTVCRLNRHHPRVKELTGWD
jgi:hypothetical protein